MSKAIITNEAILPEQIADWKNQHPRGIYAIEVPESDEPESAIVTGYFRKPSINELGMVAKKDTGLKDVEVIYNTCFLGGHPAFMNDDDVKMAALRQMGSIIKVRNAEIKKL